MRRILYLHGFNSSPASIKASQLREYLDARGLGAAFTCPELPHQPARAIALIESLIAHQDPATITLVGSSLGGFYAVYLTEKYRCKSILVNPSLAAQDSLARRLGPQTNLYTGERYAFTSQHLDELGALSVARPARLDHYWVLVETGDEVLDYREALARLSGARVLVIDGGDHAFQAWPALLPEVLRFAGLSVPT